jgi:hypothetical protein
VGFTTRLRHYRGLASTATRIARMLETHRFGTVRDIFHHVSPEAFGAADGRAHESGEATR